ncbi:hypothetical protein M8J77_023272 [Diaphorina citri]|nr:hypothetical protein M8J77_023272 [Diaphorina citri]
MTAAQHEDPTDATVASTSKTCYSCGNAWHPRSSCPAKDAQCTTCSKTGHYSRVCQSKSFLTKNQFSRRQKTSASTATSASVTAAAPSSLQSLRLTLLSIMYHSKLWLTQDHH